MCVCVREHLLRAHIWGVCAASPATQDTPEQTGPGSATWGHAARSHARTQANALPASLNEENASRALAVTTRKSQVPPVAWSEYPGRRCKERPFSPASEWLWFSVVRVTSHFDIFGEMGGNSSISHF